MYDLDSIHKYANIYSHEMYLYSFHYGNLNKYSLETLEEIYNYYSTNFPNEWSRAFKDNCNYYHRVERLKKRITRILKKPSVFLTITFSDLCLKSTNAQTRRKYVLRYLKSIGATYVANIDFGSLNGREHYHAVVGSQNIDYTAFGYGAVNGKKIVGTDCDIKLSKYILKFVRHAIKSSTHNSRILYSRD